MQHFLTHDGINYTSEAFAQFTSQHDTFANITSSNLEEDELRHFSAFYETLPHVKHKICG